MISDNMKKIFEIGLVPLIVLEDAQDAVPFGQALVRGESRLLKLPSVRMPAWTSSAL